MGPERHMSYKSFAMNEFRAAGWLNEEGTFKDNMQGRICDHILKLLALFSEEGHSGSSAAYAIGLFEKLASFEPITPITGEDWEWNEVGDGMFQNKRCGHVFKDANRFNGQAYDIDGIVFYDDVTLDDGTPYRSHYTCGDSHVPITFPYTPKREYRKRPEEQ